MGVFIFYMKMLLEFLDNCGQKKGKWNAAG